MGLLWELFQFEHVVFDKVITKLIFSAYLSVNLTNFHES